MRLRVKGKLIVVSLLGGLVCLSAWAEDVYTLTVHGVVKGLPGQGRAQNEVLVKHDPIPEYRDSSGAVVGMDAMTMPFYLADGVTAAELKVGDEVQLKVEQRIAPKFSEKVVGITKLK